MARTYGQTHGGGSGPAKGTYAYAKKQNPNIDKLINQRKGLKKGTREYNAIQNQINAAYGKGTTKRPTGEGTPSSKPKMKETSKGAQAGPIKSGASSSKETLKTGVGSAAKAAAAAAKPADKPAAKAKAVKSTRAEKLRARADLRRARSEGRAAKYRPGGKKYVGEDRLEREASRGPSGEARVALYEKKRARQANRRDIRGERRAMRMEGRAQKAENRAAMKARSAEAREERKTTYSRAGGGKVYKRGGKTEKYFLGGLVAGGLAKKALKGTAMGDKIGQTKIGGMLGFEKGGKVVAQGATKKDVRREKRQARKSGRKA